MPQKHQKPPRQRHLPPWKKLPRSLMTIIVAALLLLLINNNNLAEAIVICALNNPTLGDALCQSKYHANSRCIIPSPSTNTGTTISQQDEEEVTITMNGQCSNPFQSGCLHNYLDGFPKKRVCNSEDANGAAERGECAMVEFTTYQEVRILNQVRE